jgi:hypothetical protein
MSALPAEITEASPARVGPRPAPPGSKLRAERRAEQAAARRTRRRWAAFCITIFLCSFGLAVGILDVLH